MEKLRERYLEIIVESVRTFIINGVCVKERDAYTDIDELELERRIKAHEDIGIQIDKRVYIYCSPELSSIIDYELYSESPNSYDDIIVKAYKENNLSFIVD